MIAYVKLTLYEHNNLYILNMTYTYIRSIDNIQFIQ